ncbi:uncharacterized protein LOC127529812 [Erpetoichthys calabaricus]|uniref:uncharacterized protein LOC127529812 n=1 Tax=Erpetoichthys calabaricus TaxID=27687 RepID=UPI002234C069|nr:uncharacterized protein LOC127529812 [Erpetoichthys calabaricus]
MLGHPGPAKQTVRKRYQLRYNGLLIGLGRCTYTERYLPVLTPVDILRMENKTWEEKGDNNRDGIYIDFGRSKGVDFFEEEGYLPDMEVLQRINFGGELDYSWNLTDLEWSDRIPEVNRRVEPDGNWRNIEELRLILQANPSPNSNLKVDGRIPDVKMVGEVPKAKTQRRVSNISQWGDPDVNLRGGSEGNRNDIKELMLTLQTNPSPNSNLKTYGRIPDVKIVEEVPKVKTQRRVPNINQWGDPDVNRQVGSEGDWSDMKELRLILQTNPSPDSNLKAYGRGPEVKIVGEVPKAKSGEIEISEERKEVIDLWRDSDIEEIGMQLEVENCEQVGEEVEMVVKRDRSKNIVPLIFTFSTQAQMVVRILKQNFLTAQILDEDLTEIKLVSAFRRNKNLKDYIVRVSCTIRKKKQNGRSPKKKKNNNNNNN